jgi:hypothetical protein
MKGLVHIADQVDEELERNGAVGTIQRGVCQSLLVVEDPVYRAITPPVTSTSRDSARLRWTITVAVIACSLGRDVVIVPGGGLPVSLMILISPCSDIGQTRVPQ